MQTTPPFRASRLTDRDEPALEECLMAHEILNAFLLASLAQQPVHQGHWIGVYDANDTMEGGVYLHGEWAVLFSRLSHPPHLGGLVHALRPRVQKRPMLGPAALTSALGQRYEGALLRSHQLMVLTQATAPTNTSHRLKTAKPSDLGRILSATVKMESEDMGRVPHNIEDLVKSRLQQGRTWLMEQSGELIFMVNQGVKTAHTCQLAGTWVPNAHRRQGLARQGMAQAAQRALEISPTVSLHVHEKNIPALKAYASVGFVAAHAMCVVLFGS